MRISDWSSDVCSSDLHADGDEGNEAGNDEIYAGWNNDSISGDAQAIADGHAESDSVNKAEGTNSEAGNDLILAGGGANVVAGDSQAISGAGSASAFGSNEARSDERRVGK